MSRPIMTRAREAVPPHLRDRRVFLQRSDCTAQIGADQPAA
jgi:hypothetical protein